MIDETEHTCQFCYYEYFDSRAYPCSMCVCGEERKDMFMPKGRQNKRKTEPTISKMEQDDEPQTEWEKSASKAVLTARCLNCNNAKACKENNWQGCRFEPIEDEPQMERE